MHRVKAYSEEKKENGTQTARIVLTVDMVSIFLFYRVFTLQRKQVFYYFIVFLQSRSLGS